MAFEEIDTSLVHAAFVQETVDQGATKLDLVLPCEHWPQSGSLTATVAKNQQPAPPRGEPGGSWLRYLGHGRDKSFSDHGKREAVSEANWGKSFRVGPAVGAVVHGSEKDVVCGVFTKARCEIARFPVFNSHSCVPMVIPTGLPVPPSGTEIKRISFGILDTCKHDFAAPSASAKSKSCASTIRASIDCFRDDAASARQTILRRRASRVHTYGHGGRSAHY
jgi:hypothetical protein